LAKTIIMPRFGMTQEEATIVRWIKKEGERVEYGDPICEVTTDKINMEVEATGDGILAGIRFAEDETVPVTAVIAYILAEGESIPIGEPTPSAAAPVASPAPVTDRQVEATPVARRMAGEQGVDLAILAAATPGSGQGGKITRQDVERFLASQGEGKPTAVQPGKVRASPALRASPAARRLARQGQVDLRQVKGSGAEGRIQGWDVQAATARPAAQPKPVKTRVTTQPPPAMQPAWGAPPGGVQPQAIKLEGMRRTIAQRMQASWQNIPHILFSLDIDMTQSVAMRESFNTRFGGEKSAISMSAVLVKACAAALRQHPLLNGYFRDDQILLLPNVNIGLAVALEEGLIVPVVKDADQKSLYQIGQEVNDLSSRARQGALRPEDVVDGTFTISNLGMFGVDQFTAIINPPQVAILAIGRIAKRFVPDEYDQPVLRAMMTVTLAVDHRVIDGAGAARFLNTLRGILETAGAQWG